MLRCFYCNVPTYPGGREMDHFPVPVRAGGTNVVPACKTCHTLKDRKTVGDWDSEIVREFTAAFGAMDWDQVPPVVRLFLAKCAVIVCENPTPAIYGDDEREAA